MFVEYNTADSHFIEELHSIEFRVDSCNEIVTLFINDRKYHEFNLKDNLDCKVEEFLEEHISTIISKNVRRIFDIGNYMKHTVEICVDDEEDYDYELDEEDYE